MATGTGQIHFIDGSLDWSGGVDSIKVTTVSSQLAPNGLSRNQLAWLINGTVRDAGILPRTGWQRICEIHPGSGVYQGGLLYDPTIGNPYLIVSIAGEIFSVDVDVPAVTNLSAAFGEVNPVAQPYGNFLQAEQFAVIQAGDLVTNPLIWDNATLRRSTGITTTAVAPGTPGINELPPATAMDYYQGRIWYAQGRSYSAGDIIGGNSGTAPYNYFDAILNVTESPLVLGGDGFSVPTQAGNIRALFHNANINAPLGEGQLFIGTPKAIYAQQVPITRNDWISITSNNQPVQTVVQLINGPVNDRCITKVNGDIFYQTLDPSIASLFASVRNFGQWGNRSISNNVQRLLAFVDRSLMRASATGVVFNNRVLQASLPKQTAQGVVNQAIVPLDMIPISSFGAMPAPVWEGIYEGLDVLQLFSADFGGRDRAFAVVVSRLNGSIELWELTDSRREDYNISGDARTTMVIEFPAFTWGQELELKKLVAAELWIDKLSGTVDFTMEWRPDSDPCWKHWKAWQLCSAKNSCEDVYNPICYPIEQFRESYRSTITLPKPPETCDSLTKRPAHIGYQFQCRLTVKGWCRIRALALHAERVDRKLYAGIIC